MVNARRSNAFPEQKSGFTLIELIIVVIIIGILAGIAIPTFVRTAEKVRGDEAVANLRLIFTGQRMYRLDNNIYCSALKDVGAGGLSPDYIEDMTTAARQKYFTFTLESVTSTTFTAKAARSGGGVGYNDKTIIIYQDETWGGTWPWVP